MINPLRYVMFGIAAIGLMAQTKPVSHSDPDAGKAYFSNPLNLSVVSGASHPVWEWPWLTMDPTAHSVKIDINKAAPDATVKIYDGDDAVVLDVEEMRKLIRRRAQK